MGKARPVTDADREQVRKLHAEDLSRNEIARRLGRGSRTISTIATELGLSFDRTATEKATRARVADTKARRAEIIAALYDVAQDDLAHLLDEEDYELSEVSMGSVVRYRVDRLPAQDRKALVSAISTSTSAAVRLEQVDSDERQLPAVDSWLKTMLGGSE